MPSLQLCLAVDVKSPTLLSHLSGELILQLIVELGVLSRQDILLLAIYLEMGLLQVLFSLSFTSIKPASFFSWLRNGLFSWTHALSQGLTGSLYGLVGMHPHTT